MFQDGKLIHRDTGGNWNLEFQHIRGRGHGFYTKVNVSKSIFVLHNRLKIWDMICWFFECRSYRRTFVWKKEEYSNIWQHITHSMEDVDHWNILLFLSPCEDVEDEKEWLQLPEKTTDVLVLFYVFSSQYKEKEQALKDEEMVFVKVKVVDSVIIILHHPGSSIG